MRNKLIISVAPTGNRLKKRDHPYVPVTPEEIARDLAECCEAGASLAHVHVRDYEERPSNRPQDFERVWDLLKQANCPIIREASLAGKSTTDYSLLGILETDAEMASLGMGSVNYLERVNLFEPDFIRALAGRMKERRIRPELEIFDTSMVETCFRLADEGYLEEPLKYNLLFHVPGALRGTIPNFLFQVNQLPADALWGVTAMDESHMSLIPMAIIMGGHVRVGLEDWSTDQDGRPMSNVEQVRWVVQLSGLLGREVATCEEARQMLGLLD